MGWLIYSATLDSPWRYWPAQKPINLWLMKLGVTSPRSLRKAGLCAYFGLEPTPVLRFTLKHSPYYARDPTKTQDVLYVLEECDMFLPRRAALEAKIGVQIERRHFPQNNDRFK
ncbi:hypothetical protein EVAR_75491_1 [Eumeta japonica]|uniref:Uncharacterized protein n=1 Tax=Eumeta variegata TaxID=151549 RepID=A0A4C1TN19_EUMVA|nr:hypothetical protein EVAR_75491_1 [Eumeta japonica]